MLHPVFLLSFVENGVDFLTESLDLLNVLTYKLEKQNLYLLDLYFHVIIFIIIGFSEKVQVPHDLPKEQIDIFEDVRKGWGYDFMAEIVGPIKNFI